MRRAARGRTLRSAAAVPYTRTASRSHALRRARGRYPSCAARCDRSSQGRQSGRRRGGNARTPYLRQRRQLSGRTTVSLRRDAARPCEEIAVFDRDVHVFHSKRLDDLSLFEPLGILDLPEIDDCSDPKLTQVAEPRQIRLCASEQPVVHLEEALDWRSRIGRPRRDWHQNHVTSISDKSRADEDILCLRSLRVRNRIYNVRAVRIPAISVRIPEISVSEAPRREV